MLAAYGDENTESPKAGFYSCESVSNVQTGAEKFKREPRVDKVDRTL